MKRKASTTRPPASRDDIARLEDIPNVGPAVAADLRRLGITSSGQLPGRDPRANAPDSTSCLIAATCGDLTGRGLFP